MEKGRLEIKKTNKGDYAANIILFDGRKMPTGFRPKDGSLNGKIVEIIRESGQIVKIICDGKEIYSKFKTNPQNYSRHPQQFEQKKQGSYSPQDIFSKAPYNFVPLNNKVVPAQEIPEYNKYHQDRYTGYIEITIETKTPIYIRDTLTEEEYKEKLKIEEENKKRDKQKQYINPDFFSPGGLYRIPGSSLRGMIRTMVEIMSFGKFGFFDDARLYYRGLADISSLRKEYQNHMSSFDKNSKKSQYKMSAGILIKRGFNYFIIPAKGFRQINKFEARKIIESKGLKYQEYQFYKVDNGYIVVSGQMPNKKRDWLIELPATNSNLIPVPKDDIENYKSDKNRSKNVPDLLKLAENGVPCFYVRYRDTKNRERISFGHTGMFRLAYDKTIGDHIPSNLKDSNIVDIPEAIFGNEKTHSSRVFFEDAYLDSEPEKILLNTIIPKILSNPKPTCFQHYIEQLTDNLYNHPKNLAHYNSPNLIRGYKLYWHKDGKGFEETAKDAIQKHETQYTKITPVKEGAVFKGRIRFENLSDIELGALLFAIDLPEGCAHKIGMGKPLGLGSVQIKPRLFISDRKRRYTEIFFEWNGLKDETARITEFKSSFENHIMNTIGEKKTSLWDIDRMKELKTMLDFRNKPENNKTEYQELGEFRKRKVLQKPTEISKK